MFFNNQTPKQKTEYQDFLKIAGCLSNLFSDSSIPYLYYRVAEKAFCHAFEAENLSRSDVSVDAKKDTLGVGLKTFLQYNGKTLQKVAEFNSDRASYENLSPLKLVEKVSELRNKRIDFAKNTHDLHDLMYHCIVRDAGKFRIFEEPMDRVDIYNIRNVKQKKSSITFDDGQNEYSFLLTKSTLTKRFITKPIIYDFDIEILKDPLLELQNILYKKDLLLETESRIKQTIYLPLYGRNSTVFEKSGLNQWNAGGRARNLNEAYIPIPAQIHKNFKGFFPSRDTPFNLRLPTGKVMQSKICQDGGKALMSHSNRELGQWILRDVLELKEGELLTYQKLQEVNIGSVRIDKIDDLEFEINFNAIGSYEQFNSNLIL